MYVKAQLDREKAETVILEVLVTDLNAATDKEQTATGMRCTCLFAYKMRFSPYRMTLISQPAMCNNSHV